MNGNTSSLSRRHDKVLANESGLARQLSERQVSMMAIGGAIGTGLFLGSALSVRTAGPGVILTYILGAGITLLLTVLYFGWGRKRAATLHSAPTVSAPEAAD
jgi:amino acid permease